MKWIKSSHIIYLFLVCVLIVLNVDLVANRLYRSNEDVSDVPGVPEETAVPTQHVTPGSTGSPGAVVYPTPPVQPGVAVQMSSIQIVNRSGLGADVEIYDSQTQIQVAKTSLTSALHDSRTVAVPKGNYHVKIRRANGDTLTEQVSAQDQKGGIITIKRP